MYAEATLAAVAAALRPAWVDVAEPAEVLKELSQQQLYKLHGLRLHCGWPPHFAGQVWLQCAGEAGVLIASATVLKAAKPEWATYALARSISDMQNEAPWEDPPNQLQRMATEGLQFYHSKLQQGQVLVTPPGSVVCMVPLNESAVAGATCKFFDRAAQTIKNLQTVLEGLPRSTPAHAPLAALLTSLSGPG